MSKQQHLPTQILNPILFLSFICCTVGCSTFGQEEDSKKIAITTNQSSFVVEVQENDAQFLVNVAEMNLEEIMLGQLAKHNGILPQTRSLGISLENSHLRLQQQLVKLSKEKSIVIPIVPTDKTKEIFSHLRLIEGIEFDNMYCQKRIESHTSAITLFEKISKNTKDMEVQAFASATMPILKKQIEDATNALKFCQMQLSARSTRR